MDTRVGLFAISMLLFGILLTVITIIRMRSGKIALPAWGKFLLCAGMIIMLVILIAGMLPPDVVRVDNIFINTDTHPVASIPPENANAAP